MYNLKQIIKEEFQKLLSEAPPDPRDLRRLKNLSRIGRTAHGLSNVVPPTSAVRPGAVGASGIPDINKISQMDPMQTMRHGASSPVSRSAMEELVPSQGATHIEPHGYNVQHMGTGYAPAIPANFAKIESEVRDFLASQTLPDELRSWDPVAAGHAPGTPIPATAEELTPGWQYSNIMRNITADVKAGVISPDDAASFLREYEPAELIAWQNRQNDLKNVAASPEAVALTPGQRAAEAARQSTYPTEESSRAAFQARQEELQATRLASMGRDDRGLYNALKERGIENELIEEPMGGERSFRPYSKSSKRFIGDYIKEYGNPAAARNPESAFQHMERFFGENIHQSRRDVFAQAWGDRFLGNQARMIYDDLAKRGELPAPRAQGSSLVRDPNWMDVIDSEVAAARATAQPEVGSSLVRDPDWQNKIDQETLGGPRPRRRRRHVEFDEAKKLVQDEFQKLLMELNLK